MAMCLAQIYGKPVVYLKEPEYDTDISFVLPDQNMGVEIEAEGFGDSSDIVLPNQDQLMRKYNKSFWEVKSDGSLVAGREYVLDKPLKGNALAAAIESFFEVARLNKMATSSTHLHLDMREDTTTPEILQVLFALVYVLEPVLWHVGDPSRKWCGYTHSLTTMRDDVLSRLFTDSTKVSADQLRRMTGGLSRYYGLNLAALSSHGSLEFRYFPTATCKEQLVGWINLVQSYKNAALNIATLPALASLMETKEGYDSILSGYFGEWRELADNLVPYKQAYKSFLDLTEVFKGQSIPKNYELIANSNQSFAKITKKRRINRTPPRNEATSVDPFEATRLEGNNILQTLRTSNASGIVVGNINFINMEYADEHGRTPSGAQFLTNYVDSSGDVNVALYPSTGRVYISVWHRPIRAHRWLRLDGGTPGYPLNECIANRGYNALDGIIDRLVDPILPEGRRMAEVAATMRNRLLALHSI